MPPVSRAVCYTDIVKGLSQTKAVAILACRNVQKCKRPMENYFLRVRSSAVVSFKVGVG